MASKKHPVKSIVVSVLAWAFTAPAVWAVPVDVELQLLIDVSDSIDRGELIQQLQGYASALQDPDVLDAIQSGPNGSVAVQLIFWGGFLDSSPTETLQVIGTDWTHIDSLASAEAFAQFVSANDGAVAKVSVPDPADPTRDIIIPNSGTKVGPAIDFATPLFDNNDFEGLRLVMDISGDGADDADETAAARDAALAGDINTINGLVIGTDDRVRQFYEFNVIGGDNAFLSQTTNGSNAFEAAIKDKIIRELQDIGPRPPAPGIPEPATMLLGLVGVTALTGIATRRRSDR